MFQRFTHVIIPSIPIPADSVSQFTVRPLAYTDNPFHHILGFAFRVPCLKFSSSLTLESSEAVTGLELGVINDLGRTSLSEAGAGVIRFEEILTFSRLAGFQWGDRPFREHGTVRLLVHPTSGLSLLHGLLSVSLPRILPEIPYSSPERSYQRELCIWTALPLVSTSPRGVATSIGQESAFGQFPLCQPFHS
jgi:hypothetical protein